MQNKYLDKNQHPLNQKPSEPTNQQNQKSLRACPKILPCTQRNPSESYDLSLKLDSYNS